MSYIPPEEVRSPRRHLTLVAVLDDGKTPDNPTGENSVSIAVGRWKDDSGAEGPMIGMRWNGDDSNPIGNPQSRGVPTWFVVPRRLRRAIVEQLQLTEGKREVLRETFKHEFFAGPDGEGWICDTCGERIRGAREGVLEWVDLKEGGCWEGRRMFLVHHLMASPRKKRRGDDGCYIPTDQQRQANVTTNSESLEEFLGPDGLMQLLSLIADNEAPVSETLEMIQRLHLPRYERARHHLDSAIREGVIEPNLAAGFHWQEDLQRVLEEYASRVPVNKEDHG